MAATCRSMRFVFALLICTTSAYSLQRQQEVDYTGGARTSKLMRTQGLATVKKHLDEARDGSFKAPFWAFKGGDLNHSGYSAYVGAHDLSTPTWIFEEPDVMSKGEMVGPMKVFHGSPVIDGDKNVYIQSTTGWVYSINSAGQLRWSLELDDGNPGNLALLDGKVYASSQDGQVYSIDMVTGSIVWQKKVSDRSPDDTHSLTAVSGTILTACYAESGKGSFGVCALSAQDGTTKWTYNMTARGSRAYNHVASVVGNAVIFGDIAGGAYSVSLETGQENWWKAGVDYGAFSTAASLTVGPNNMAYAGFNTGTDYCSGPNTTGIVRAHRIATGDVAWSRNFSEGVNAVPAVGPLGSTIAVIVAVGNDLECEAVVKTTKMKHGKIFALDAFTGDTIWRFDTPEYDKSCAGNTPESVCCPDIWGQPSLGKDGTVYVNWSGGVSFAIKEVTRDGVIDTTDPLEFSSYAHGKGSNGNTAIAPGLTVTVDCTQLMGYSGYSV